MKHYGFTLLALAIFTLGSVEVVIDDTTPAQSSHLDAAAGALDGAFAASGIYTTSNGTRIFAMQIDGQGRPIVAGYDDSGWRVERLTKYGVLDITFGTSGAYTTSSGAEISAMQLDSQGRILIVGYQGSGEWRVERLTVDGELDITFGVSGAYTTSSGSFVNAIQLDSQGRILITGEQNDGSGGFDWRIERLTVDGELDSTFGRGGAYTTSGGASIYAVYLDSQGRIYIAGHVDAIEWRVERLTVDGDLDATFATSGGYDSTDGARIYAMQLDSQGRILIVGYDDNGWRLERLTVDGELDVTFGGGDGIYLSSYSGITGPLRARAMTIDPLGRILIAGDTISSGWRVERLTVDGVLDITFGGGDGIYSSGSGTRIHSIQIDVFGKIFIAGYDASGWRVERLSGNIPPLNLVSANSGSAG